MSSPTQEISPRPYARVAGIVYLCIIGAGLFAQLARERIIVSDPAITVANIKAHALLLRFAVVADLSTYVCAVAVGVILYALLKPISHQAALLMLTFGLVQDAIGGLNVMNTFQPLSLLGRAEYLKAFSAEQLAAMSALSFRSHSSGFGVALIFFGCSCLFLGYLIFKSGFFPKILGVLIAIAGGCYLVNSLALLLSPALAGVLFPAILLPAFIGELAFALWLTVKGPRAAKPSDCNAPRVAYLT